MLGGMPNHLSHDEVNLCAKIVEDAGLLTADVACTHHNKPAPAHHLVIAALMHEKPFKTLHGKEEHSKVWLIAGSP